MDTTPPKSHEDFGKFQPAAPLKAFLTAQDFAGLSQEAALGRAMAFLSQQKAVGDPTRNQYRIVLRLFLRLFEQKGLDLATVKPDDAATLRAFLRTLTERREANGKPRLAENSASSYVRTWNSMVKCIFGDPRNPGAGLVMADFRQSPRGGLPLTEGQMDAMMLVSERLHFRTDHNRRAFQLFMEVARATGARVGSLLQGRVRVKDIDWDNQVLYFRHMKNRDEHYALLTDRAIVRLRAWVESLAATPHWRGGDTMVFMEASGKPLHRASVNDNLRRVAAAAGLSQRITTHIFRKTVGTNLAASPGGARAAADQLGNDLRTVNKFYNLPTLAHRATSRQFLPGAEWKPRTPQEMAGLYALQYKQGKIGLDELERRLRDVSAKTEMDTARASQGGEDPGYR